MSEIYNSYPCGTCIELITIKKYIKKGFATDIVFHNGNIIYIDCTRVTCAKCGFYSNERVLCYNEGKYLLYTINGALDPIVNECEHKLADQSYNIDCGFLNVPEIGNCLRYGYGEKAKLLYIDWLTINPMSHFRRSSLYRLSDGRVFKVCVNTDDYLVFIDNYGRAITYQILDLVDKNTYENTIAKIIIGASAVTYISKTGSQTKGAIKQIPDYNH